MNQREQLGIQQDRSHLLLVLASPYTPAEDLAKTYVPILAITGSKHIQIDPAELGRMAVLVQGDFESHEVPDLTHMLRADTSPGRPTTKTYQERIKKPVDARLLEIVGAWLKKQTVRGTQP